VHSDAALFADTSAASSSKDEDAIHTERDNGGDDGARKFELAHDHVVRIEAALADTALVMWYALTSWAAANRNHISSSNSSNSSATGCGSERASNIYSGGMTSSSTSSSDAGLVSVPTKAPSSSGQQQQQLLRKRGLLQQLELLQLVDNVRCQQRGLQALWATIAAARQLGGAVYAVCRDQVQLAASSAAAADSVHADIR
jgi:hypothetical protein